MHNQNLLKLLAVHMLSVAKHLLPQNDNNYPTEPLEQLFPLFGQNIPEYNRTAINYVTNSSEDLMHQSSNNRHDRRLQNLNKKISNKNIALNNKKRKKDGKRKDWSNRVTVRTSHRSLPIYYHDISEGFNRDSDRDEEERDRKIWAEFVSNDDDEYEDDKEEDMPQYYTNFKEFVDKTSQEPNYFLSDSDQTDFDRKLALRTRVKSNVKKPNAIKPIRDIDLTGFHDNTKPNNEDKDESSFNFDEILMPENSNKNNITVEDDDWIGEMYCTGRYNEAVANVDKHCVVFYHCTEHTIDTYVCPFGTRFDNRRQICWQPLSEVYCEKEF